MQRVKIDSILRVLLFSIALGHLGRSVLCKMYRIFSQEIPVRLCCDVSFYSLSISSGARRGYKLRIWSIKRASLIA